MNFAALVLAGTRPGGDPLAGAEGKPHKALIEVDGVALLERVVTALRDAGATRTGVSCDDPQVIALTRHLGAEVMPTGPGPSESADLAFQQLQAPLVITTADHALLRPEWVRHLVEATPGDVDLSVMLARREAIDAALPGSKRTYLRFADGHWSGCNLFYLQRPGGRAAITTWKSVEADRKRPWRIVRKLGIGTLLAYAAGRLTLAQGIATLGQKIGVTACLIEAPDGLAAVDADKPQDLTDIRAVLAAQRSAG